MTTIYERLSKERKELQAQGLVPEWYTTGGLQMFKEKYEYDVKGRSIRGQFERIAKTLAKHVPHLPEAEDKFFNLLWKGWLSPSTPVLANTGTNRGLPVSCSGTVITDSVDGFYSNLREVSILTKHGFGTASDFSEIRPRGSKISIGGKANGVLPVMKEHMQAMRNISQGSARRGAFASYLDIEHGDFWEVVEHLAEEPDDFNIGWTVRQTFIDALNAGDEEAVKRFKRAMKVKMITGKGYFFFVDKANAKRPVMYKDLGLYIKNSQLCSEIMLFNDEEHTYSCVLSSMNVSKYDEWKGTDAVYWAVVFLDCVVSEFLQKAKTIPGLEKIVRATEKGRPLGLGQCGLHTLMMQKMIPFESLEAHMLSTQIAKEIRQQADQASKDLAKDLGEPEWCKGYGVRNTHRCVVGETKILTKQGQIEIKDVVGKQVEVWNGQEWSTVTPFETGVSKVLKITFSNGMELKCTPDHKFLVATPKRNPSEIGGQKLQEVEAKDMRIGDCLPKFFTEPTDSSKELQYAYTAGLFCGDGSISNAEAGKHPRNELRLYGKKMELADFVDWKSTTTWGGDDCVRGYLPDDLLPKYCVPFGYSLKSKILWLCGLIDADGSSTSKGICITMKDKSFAQEVALLVQECGGDVAVGTAKRTGGYPSSTNVYYYVNISIFSCSKIFKEDKPKRVTVTTGMDTKSKIGKYHMTEVVSIESVDDEEMTYCFTEPKMGRGIFNGVLTKQCAIAPTKSTALLLGSISEGINPDPAMVFTQTSAVGEIDRINPVLLDLMKKKGVYTKKHIQEVTDSFGSVQHVKWLTDDEKEVFKTAFEMNMEAILRMATARAKYIDQWQSLNLFFSANESPGRIAKIHQQAFVNPDILALYYVYTQAGVAAASDGCVACQ